MIQPCSMRFIPAKLTAMPTPFGQIICRAEWDNIQKIDRDKLAAYLESIGLIEVDDYNIRYSNNMNATITLASDEAFIFAKMLM